jgi:metal-responsive CopG/Arc/MetJ family transcriptional regulator
MRSAKTTTVNIAFPKRLLHQIDETAEEEARSRSDLLREAARRYLEQKEQWSEIFSFGSQRAKTRKIRPEDISTAIRAYRKAA